MLFQALLTFNEHGFSDEVEKKVLPSLNFLGKCELCCNVSSSLGPCLLCYHGSCYTVHRRTTRSSAVKEESGGTGNASSQCQLSVPASSKTNFCELCFLVHRVLYSSLANKTIMRRVYDMGKYGPMSMTC